MGPQKGVDLQNELAQMRRQVEKLETEKLLQRDEIRALKSEARSYQDELRSLNSKVQRLEGQALQEALAGDIGKQVRLRYLERHRQRMGRGIGKIGYERIRCGDRAAHRGRPVVDALLCLTGLMTDQDVYANLYGVSPEQMKQLKDIPEVIEIAGFHASLQSEGRLTNNFKALFGHFSTLAKGYASPTELRAAFSEDKTLQRLQAELQDCYDKIVAANPRGQQNSNPQQNR